MNKAAILIYWILEAWAIRLTIGLTLSRDKTRFVTFYASTPPDEFNNAGALDQVKKNSSAANVKQVNAASNSINQTYINSNSVLNQPPAFPSSSLKPNKRRSRLESGDCRTS
jgi:hypothetical protein